MTTPWKMNRYILDYILKDYAGKVPEGEVRLDCSLGVNQLPLANPVFQTLSEFCQETEASKGNFRIIKEYPHDESLKDTLAHWYHKQGVG